MKVLSVILLLSLTVSYVCCGLFSDPEEEEVQKRQLPLETMNETQLRASINSSWASITPAVTKRVVDYEKANLTLLANVLIANTPFFATEQAMMEQKLNATTDTKKRQDILLSLAKTLVKVAYDEEWRAAHPYNLSEKCDDSIIQDVKFGAALTKLMGLLDLAKVAALTDNEFWKQFISDIKVFYFNTYTKALTDANKLDEPLKCQTLSLFAKDINRIFVALKL